MSLIIKVIGALILILSSTLCGFYAALTLKLRERQLSNYKWYITELKERIFYEETEADPLIKSIFGDSGTVKRIKGKYYISDKSLKNRDKEILNEFFSRLGSSEKESEIARAELCLSLLEAERITAAKQIEERSRLYKILGVCAGAVCSILLI